jgi:hypothetical protein
MTKRRFSFPTFGRFAAHAAATANRPRTWAPSRTKTWKRIPEFREDYINGFYDRTCDVCGGSGKVAQVDRKRTPPDQLAAYDEERRHDAECRRERLMEARMLGEDR